MATYQGHNEDSSGNILLPLANGMVAKVETGTTASQAYTKGTYFSANNRFCKAKTAIASGDTLTSGTNYTATSVGAEMKSHLQLSDGSKEFYFDYQNSKYGWNEKADRSGTFHPFGGTIKCIARANAYGDSATSDPYVMTKNKSIDSTYITLSENTSGEGILTVFTATLTFKQACSGFISYNYTTLSGTATKTAIVSSNTVYSNKLYSFSATANQTIIFKSSQDYGAYGGYQIFIS